MITNNYHYPIPVPCAPNITHCPSFPEDDTVSDRTYCTSYFRCLSGLWTKEDCPPYDPNYKYYDNRYMGDPIPCNNNIGVCTENSECAFTVPYHSSTTEALTTAGQPPATTRPATTAGQPPATSIQVETTTATPSPATSSVTGNVNYSFMSRLKDQEKRTTTYTKPVFIHPINCPQQDRVV